MKHIPINRILLSLLFGVAIILVSCTYLLAFHQNPPIEFNVHHFPVDKSEYSVGEYIVITTDYCRYTNVSYKMHLDFVNGLRFSTPIQHRAGASEGCGVVDVAIVKVPESLPPGTYYLKGKNEYQVNFLATRVVEWHSQAFIILP